MRAQQLKHHSISKPVYPGLSKTEIVIWPKNAISLYCFFFFNFCIKTKHDLILTSIFTTWLAFRSGVGVASRFLLLRRWPFKGRLRLLSSFCDCCRNEADTGTCRYVLHWIERKGSGRFPVRTLGCSPERSSLLGGGHGDPSQGLYTAAEKGELWSGEKQGLGSLVS